MGDAEELAGQYEFGAEIDVDRLTTNPAVSRLLSEQAAQRVTALAQFTLGLGYYQLGKHDKATQHFNEATNIKGWDDHSGKEVLYLFLGNNAGKLGNLTSARVFYSRALRINPEYARAQIGIAETIFHRSMGSCEAGNVNVAGLKESASRYELSLQATSQPALSNIKNKVAFGLGRIYLCLSQALVADHWADAEYEFKKVTSDFESGNDRIRNLAAQAYANLGLIYLPFEGDSDAERKYQQAVHEYQKAIAISQKAKEKANYYHMLGYIFSRLGVPDEADKAYVEAIRLNPEQRDSYEQLRKELPKTSVSAPNE